MREKNYNFFIITPLIMSGSDKNKVELRTPSIKGMLRWWFRFYKSSFLNVDELRKFESEIFGSTENSSLFYMRLLEEPQGKEDAYLCMNDKSRSSIRRNSFSPSQSFELSFKFFPHFKYQDEIENSLMLLSLFGGIGARWRRGFGSVQIENSKLKSNTLENLSNEVTEKIKNLKGNNKPDNFLSISNTKIYLIKPKDKFWTSWDSAMDDLRVNFYRELKRSLGVAKIACKPSSGNREVSPLIIQIKKVNDNYFGVILVWEGWNRFRKVKEFLEELENYEVKKA